MNNSLVSILNSSFPKCALALLLLATTTPAPAAPVLRVLDASQSGRPLLQNGGFEQLQDHPPAPWRAWQNGFLSTTNARSGSRAIECSRTDGAGEYGASQTLVLNRTNIAPFVIRGWSRAESVSGSPDNGYSLYVDIVYHDGTPLWGRTAPFPCGTHDWQSRELLILPEKPVRSLTLHCLFRGHTGTVWFDDISLEELVTPDGAVLFHGAAVEPPVRTKASVKLKPTLTIATGDGLSVGTHHARIVSLQIDGVDLAGNLPGGFLVRDFKARSDIHTLTNGSHPGLDLALESRFIQHSNHLVVEGSLLDLTGRDRALTLFFALPAGQGPWAWGDDVRQSRDTRAGGEFANTVPLRSGAAGRMSRYPFGAIWNSRAGLGLGYDLQHPAQYTIFYHQDTRQLVLACDLALVPDSKTPSAAPFRFVLFRFNPEWGFRAALERYYAIFPNHFTKRVKREGVWMPFTDISRVPNHEDFGFAFQEGAPNVPFDDTHNISSFVYVEPMSYWLALPPAAPRTYDSALQILRSDLAGTRTDEQRRMAAATLNSGIHDADGQFALYLVKAPWCDGGVFTLNPDPDLPVTDTHPFTKATVMQRAIQAAFAKNRPRTNDSLPGAGLDGVYFDSLEMSATHLNHRRDHFRAADLPLVFDSDGRPCQLMIFNTTEFIRETAASLHRQNRLTFANSVLWNFSFPAPWLDVMGTEVNWLRAGEFAPDTDATMNFRRALCRQKPYCLLLNSDYAAFNSGLVEKFFQRCLFYGVWPGFFDQDAASKDPYWASTNKWFERDRPLFKKYIPLFQKLTAAGWEPVTAARTDNPHLWLERFGDPARGSAYLTVFNDTPAPQEALIRLSTPFASSSRNPVDLFTGKPINSSANGWPVRLNPGQVAMLQFPR